MQKFYRTIVRHPKIILTFFLAAAIAGIFCQSLVAVNYDMNDYLPPDSASTRALNLLRQEFEGGIPNARVMVRNVSIAEALEYKELFRSVDGVTDVTWLDDVTDVRQPLSMLDQDEVETYYRDENALFTLTIADEKRVQAVDGLRAIIGNENAMTGAAVSSAVATTSTVTEIRLISAFAVLFVLIVLTLSTTSWIEPIVVLVSLGVAIMINNGSNLIFGEISFVSNAAGSILQLAVSLDYSVFLIHRFGECKVQIDDEQEAMVQALCMSTGSILSSGLTTVIGFLALCLMQFQIGPDLGLVLAKGVAISLITVFVFSPVLILSIHHLMEKTRHRNLLPSFRILGRAVYRLMIPAVLIFLMLIYPANRASNSNEYYYGSAHIFGPDTQLGADTAEIEEIFGNSDTYVLMVPRGDVVRERALSDALKELPAVTSILSYVDVASPTIPTQFVREDTLSLLMSEHYSRLVLSVNVDFEGAATFEFIDRIREIAEEWYPGAWKLAGEGVSTEDLMNTVTADMTKVNFIAIAAVFLVLLVSMKSLLLPVILVLAIETAIWINLSLPYFFDKTIFYIAYLIISSIQLGATVDYAILFTDRYLEHRRTMGKRDAIVRTISAVTASILTSGMTLTVVGFLLGYLSTHGLLSQLGMFLGKGTLCSLIIVLFVLPGLLYLLDGPIRRTSIGLKLAPAKLRAGKAALVKVPGEGRETPDAPENSETSNAIEATANPAVPTARTSAGTHETADAHETPAASAEAGSLEQLRKENEQLRREIEMLKEAQRLCRSALQWMEAYDNKIDQTR